ncbi:MAG: hypothetical protein V3V33_15695 [Candidatus Lokiarchaeia archaeon]
MVLLDFIPTSLALRIITGVMRNGSIAFDPVGLNLILITIWGIGLILLGILLFRRKTAIL